MTLDKTFDAQEAEARIYAEWEAAGAFRAGANASKDETFSIVIPPPNVTGSLHMGHAFNNTLQDILVRWHRMRGHDTLWQPGTDHAGIATQMVVERELAAEGNVGRREMGREKFIERVWQQKVKSRGNIRSQLERLGASCDWSREAFTMGGAPGDPDRGKGPNFHDAVIKVFVDMYHKGLIYRGKRLVNWDPHFETAISDLEVENVETPGHMWHFKYPLAGGETYTYVEKDEDGNVLREEERDYISIATTRPETMLGDGAVAVHPSDARYAPIVGKLCEIPVGPKEHRRLIPIITDEYPDPAFGSGAVKITGAHDFNDYAVAERGGIPKYRLMDTKGQMRDDGAPYAEAAAIATAVARGERTLSEAETDAVNLVPDELRGLDRFEARDLVVRQITAEGLAVMTTADDPNTSPPSIAMEGRRKRKELGVWVGPSNEVYVCETFDEAVSQAKVRYPGKEIRLDTSDEPMGEGFYDPNTHREIVWLRPAFPKVENKLIMQPFGDRSKVVIEPMLTDQWFVDAEKIVGPAIEAVKKGKAEGGTDILPESDRKVYFHWLENIEPWCISRQLWWGHQVPVWYDRFGNKFCAATFESAAADAIEHHKTGNSEDVFTARELRDEEAFKLGTISSMATGGDAATFAAAVWGDDEDEDGNVTITLRRDPDVLDTWFSSGLWPIGTLGWPEDTPELQKYFPTSVLITGFDIIFFWVARMMMMQYAVVGQKPFDTVYVHALVRDEKGKKMSKSLGNVLDPLELIDDYGADAVRFTLTAMAAMGRDLRLSTERIAGYRNFGTKLWNAIRFAEMNGVYEPGVEAWDKPQSPSLTANAWIVGETARVREEVDAALEAFRFNDAANALYAFIWGKVCDWYVEFSKPLLEAEDPGFVQETRETMRWVLDQCVILLHPIMPFITEELWQTTAARAKMLIHADWPDYRAADLVDANADKEMTWVISLIEGIRSARAQVHVPAGLKIPMLQLELDQFGQMALNKNQTLIRRLARVETITEVGEMPKGAITVAVEGGTFGLPLAEIIDVAEERARLEKTLGKLDKEIAGLKGRLGNPKFVESAPEEVVEEARQNLAARQDEAAKLRAAVDRLAELE